MGVGWVTVLCSAYYSGLGGQTGLSAAPNRISSSSVTLGKSLKPRVVQLLSMATNCSYREGG